MFYDAPLPPIEVRQPVPQLQVPRLYPSPGSGDRPRLADRTALADRLVNQGFEQLGHNQLAAAIQSFQQALAIYQQVGDREKQASVLTSLGSIYYRLGKYPLVVKYCEQSWEISKHLGVWQEFPCLFDLGDSHRILGNYARATTVFQRLIGVLREIDKPLEEAVALRKLGDTLLQAGDLPQAEQVLRDGISVLESYWQESDRFGNDGNDPGESDFLKAWFFEYQAPIYGVLQQVLVAQKKYIAALEISERGRNRAFMLLLNTTARSQPNSLLSSSLPIAQRVRAIAQNHQATLVQYSVIAEQSTVAGSSQEQETHLYIWVIQPNGTITFRAAALPSGRSQHTIEPTPAPQLTDLIQNARTTIRGIRVIATGPDDASPTNSLRMPIQSQRLSQQLQQLHRLLIQPIADLLPTDPHQKLILIPHRALLLVPFAALQNEQGQYLLEKHTLSIAPSMQTLAWTQEQQQRLGQTSRSHPVDSLIVGNPTMPTVTLVPDQPPQPLMALPGAEREAIAIANLLHTNPLLGAAATEARVLQRLPTARIIHLATHGLLNDIEGFKSALAFAPTPQDDGLLHAQEIMGLHLNAELVVLSACDTGRGRVLHEGIMGLPRSLLLAGAPSVIVSLWAIPDAPTAFLMTQFYQTLQQKPDKAYALREAMLATLKRYPHPVDWAAFTLMGEP